MRDEDVEVGEGEARGLHGLSRDLGHLVTGPAEDPLPSAGVMPAAAMALAVASSAITVSPHCGVTADADGVMRVPSVMRDALDRHPDSRDAEGP